MFGIVKVLTLIVMPLAVAQFVLRPVAYGLIASLDGLEVKLALLHLYSGLVVALLAYFAKELFVALKSANAASRASTAVALVVCVLINPLSFMARDYGLITDLQRLEQITLRRGDFRATYRDRIVSVSGAIDETSLPSFRAALAQGPVEQVVLNSTGGMVAVALQLAREIAARDLPTHVERNCYSACTLVFLAGSQRTADTHARFGFHAAYRKGHDGLIASDRVNDLLIDAMIRQGVDPSFSTKAWSYPPDDLWLPTRRELLSAGYLLESAS